MLLRISSKLIFALCFGVFSVTGAVCASQEQATASQEKAVYPANIPRQQDSEKDLFRKAENSIARQEWDNAYKALEMAFEKRKGKTHKKYTPLFESLKGRFVAREARLGREALAHDDLETCEKHLAAARNYAQGLRGSPAAPALELQQALDTRKAELRKQFNEAVAQGAAQQFDSAAATLRKLLPLEPYVPGVAAELARQNKAHTEYLLQRVNDLFADRQWPQARNLLSQVLQLDPENATASEGIKRIERGSEADELITAAQEQLDKKSFRAALTAVDAALKIDPAAQEVVKPIRDKIVAAWSDELAASLPPLIAASWDFAKSRDALNHLEILREIAPGNPAIAVNLADATANYGNNAWERADELAARMDMSRVATAYTLLLSAENNLEAGLIRPEVIKELASGFNRKRAVQIVVSVENLCGAPETFVDAIRTRAMSTLNRLGLPDLAVRTIEDYTASPNEDTQFQELRPDGKSYTALLTIEIQRYRAERQRPVVRTGKSSFLERMEEVQNPEWLKKREELGAVQNQKKGNKDERASRLQKLAWELEEIPRTINSPVIRPYEYQIREYSQAVEVTLAVRLKDRLANTFILAGEEIGKSASENGREISGVHTADQNGLQNQPLTMNSPEESLRQIERETGESLEAQLPDLVTPFTHRFLTEGKNRLRQNQSEDAVEYLLCYWASVRGKLDEADAALIIDSVKQETGYDLKRNEQEFMLLVSPVHTVR